MAKLHVGIAGAGLAGRCLAWRLARAGWRVTLFDARSRDALDTASMAAAAMLSPLAERAMSDATVFALGQRSMQLWPQWIGELHAAQSLAGFQERLQPFGGSGVARVASMPVPDAQPVYFRQQGTLVVAHAQDQSSLAHFKQLLLHKLPAASQAQVQPVDASALAVLEPALAGRFDSGLHLLGEGQLDNGQWMDALALELDRLGVVWHEGVAVHSLAAHRIRGVRVSTPTGCASRTGTPDTSAASRCGAAVDVVPDVVVDARGVGSKSGLPHLRGVRGEVLRVECAGVELQRPVRLMHPRYQIYVVPRPNHGFVVGATELESQDSGPVTLRSMLELGSALYSLHPAFGEARIQRLSAALRPALDDNLPVCLQQDGVWHLNGLYRHGYLCGPALVESLLQNILESGT